MKGIAFILIFLFLTISVVSATTETFTSSGAESHSYSPTQAYDGHPSLTSFTINVDNVPSPRYVTFTISAGQWQGGAEDYEYESVGFYIGATQIGSGRYGYSKNQVDSSRIINVIFSTGLDFSGYSGLQTVTITAYDGSLPLVKAIGVSHLNGGFTYDSDIGITVNPQPFSVRTYQSYYFENTYTYYSDMEINYIDVEKPAGMLSQWVISDSYGDLINETSMNDDDISLGHYNTSPWYLDVENVHGDIFSDIISFAEGSVGTIKLNQTSYTEPELIQIDVELTTYDFTDHSYYIISEVSEDLDYWDNVAGSYNGTTKITTTTATRILEVDTWLYDLPIWIRSRLVDYNKLTGEYITLDTTPAVLFNPPIPGSIKFGGTVIDSDTNQIISGALVSVDGVTTASDTTNAWGEFLIYLYPGIYTVTTSKTGYQTSTSEDLLMEYDNTWAQIYLTPIGYGNGTLYGNVNDADTGYAIKDVHVIITNATDQIDAYTSSGGYYEATGLAQSSTYTIQAVKSGYYTYNGSVTTEASGASHKSFNMVSETATPTPTPTVLPTSTYPGGEGHEWTNDEIVTMLRVIVPGFFLLMLVFLLLAVMLGLSGNNGNNGQGRSGLGELWRR